MLINLRNALMAGKRLPYDAEVEFLESTGTQWIDTGWCMQSDDMRFESEMMRTANGGLANFFFGYRFVNSAVYRGDMRTFFIYGANQIGRIAIRYGVDADNSSSIIPLNTKVSVLFDGTSLSVDGVVFASLTRAYTPASYGTMFLFDCNTGDTYRSDVSRFIGRMYSFKIWQGDVLVRDYIAVRKSGVGYLYDRASGQLFGNAGTGNFVCGPDVVPVEYLEGDGNAYIDTGIANDDNLEIYAEAKVPTFTNSKAIFGVTGTAGQTTAQRLITARESSSAYWITLQRAKYGYYGRNRIAWDGDWHEYWLSKSTAKIDSSQKASANIASNTSETIYLFAGNNGGTVYGQCACLIRGFTISNSGTLILRLLPVRVGTEGAMMDVLTRRIYRNAGTGAFTYGNDLKYPIPAE